MTPYDIRAFGRGLGMALALSILALVAMAATDEVMATGGTRMARLAVLAPVTGAVGAALTNARARARGETLALLALGASPWRVQAGALSAAMVVGLLGASLLASDVCHLQGLFPRLEVAHWMPGPQPGAWNAPALGVQAGPHSSDLMLALPTASLDQGLPGRAPVVSAVLALAVVLSPWLELRVRYLERLAAASVAALTAVTAFHLVAAGRVGAWWLLAAPALLAAHIVARGRAFDRAP